MHRGYIRHYRAVREHWLHDNANYYMAWFDIIMLVNHEEKKLLIDGELMTCKRGEALYSISTWANKLGKWWTVQKVKTFFKLLEVDNMIYCSGMRKTTRLSVVNYERYNKRQLADNEEITSSQLADNQQLTTTKELLITKKNEKEKDIVTFDESKPTPAKVFEMYNNICKDLKHCRKLTKERTGKINSRIKELKTIEEWEHLFKTIQDTPFCKGNNNREWKADIDWIIKNDGNYNKVLEGKYDGLGNNQQQQEIKFDNKNYEKIKSMRSTPEEKEERKRKLEQSRSEARKIVEGIKVVK